VNRRQVLEGSDLEKKRPRNQGVSHPTPQPPGHPTWPPPFALSFGYSTTAKTTRHPDSTTQRDGDEEYPGIRRNGTMVAITNATTNQGQGIKRQGGQGVVLDLHLKGDGIWNASVPRFQSSLPSLRSNRSQYLITIAYIPSI